MAIEAITTDNSSKWTLETREMLPKLPSFKGAKVDTISGHTLQLQKHR
ncbi:MAG: hypothetical protein ABJH75_20160 [Roseibium sp.]